ncbi:MAG: SDR family NAD(P)-dependent oxidoreductase [Alistipes sp.]
MKKIVIIGATSGMGFEVAKRYVQAGWRVGAAGRRTEELVKLKATAPEQIEIETIDITQEEASAHLDTLIDRLGGMDIFLHCSGIGSQNIALEQGIELRTTQTNVVGFTRMVTAAFAYFREHGGGHIAVVSSIAGTKGIGSAPSYSASKRFQNTYIDALAQLSYMEHLKIHFTDIRPGFVATALLKDGKYPMLMRADKVAEAIFKAIATNKRRKIIDSRYAFFVFFWRLIPEWLWERMTIKSAH